MIRLMLGDCLERMREIETGSVNMVLADLPYGTTRNAWDSVIPLEPLWKEYWRVCRGAVVLTASQPFASNLVVSGMNTFKYEWVWVKSKITGVLNAKLMPVRKHELILVFSKNKNVYNPQNLIPKNSVTKQGGNSDNYGSRNTEPYVQLYTNWPRDVLEIPSEGNTVHPTQKPVALFEYLIRTYSNEGDVVLDNTMGSGTTGVACVNTRRSFIGIEKDETYFAIAERRIAEAAFD